MKNINIRSFCILGVILLAFSSCKKESDNIFNMFDGVNVEFDASQPSSVTDYKQLEDGDDAFIYYTITSTDKNMASVCVRRVGQGRPDQQINLPDDADKKSYTGSFKLPTNRVGKTTYRVYALDSKGVYMGDGYKDVTIDVVSNFKFLINRRVYLPDSTTKIAPCYYSIDKGESYSFTTGEAASEDLDFGIYRVAGTGSDNIDGYLYYLYTLTASPLPFTPYDISSWAKTETLLTNVNNNSRDYKGNNSRLTSGSAIESYVSGKKPNLKVQNKPLKIGQIVYLKKQDGRYAALEVEQISRDYDGKLYMSFSIKSQIKE